MSCGQRHPAAPGAGRCTWRCVGMYLEERLVLPLVFHSLVFGLWMCPHFPVAPLQCIPQLPGTHRTSARASLRLTAPQVAHGETQVFPCPAYAQERCSALDMRVFSNISIQPAPTELPVFGVCMHSSALVWTVCLSCSQKRHLGMRHRGRRDGGDRVDGKALR